MLLGSLVLVDSGPQRIPLAVSGILISNMVLRCSKQNNPDFR